MSKFHRIAAGAFIALAAGAASAQEATPDTWINEAKSTLTREQVRAELAAAVAATKGKHPWADVRFFADAASTRTRGEVVAELLRARESGEYDVINAEAPMPGAPLQRSTFYAQRQPR